MTNERGTYRLGIIYSMELECVEKRIAAWTKKPDFGVTYKIIFNWFRINFLPEMSLIS
jgi:hypothetical protein